MTNYYFTSSEDPLAGTAWQEAKEKRKQLLAEVRRRRVLRYKAFMHKKRRLHAGDDLV
jgi:hypothetical protein